MASMYDRNAVEHMWKELETIGVHPLTKVSDVDRFMKDKEGTAMVVVNSVCGCAARAYIRGFSPSSPSVVLFKDGEVVFMLERKDIEGFSALDVSQKLIRAFEEHCTAEGPSVSKDILEETFEF